MYMCITAPENTAQGTPSCQLVENSGTASAHSNVRVVTNIRGKSGMEAREALRMGIGGGARNLGRDEIGQIAPGFAADFVAWRTDSIGFAGAGKDPVAGLLYCTPSIGSVDLSVINGDVVVRDGELLTLDLKVGAGPPPLHA